MPKKKKTRDVEEILDGNIDQFEKGLAGRAADDLNEMIRKLGRYEDEGVSPRPVLETDRETPPAEEDLRTRNILRVEIHGDDCEIVCGQIRTKAKDRIEEHCRQSGLAVSDIWYWEDEAMTRFVGPSWTAWYDVDDFFHETGLLGRTASSFSIIVTVDGEAVEDFNTRKIKTTRTESGSKPEPRKDHVAVTAGTIGEGRYAFEMDIDGEFVTAKLEFAFLDLSNLGLQERLLIDVRYDGESMFREEEVVRDLFTVTFL
jgi:hypothetical protein